jgi:hypothetical protein
VACFGLLMLPATLYGTAGSGCSRRKDGSGI